MKRFVIFVFAVALVSLPAVAFAHQGTSAPKTQAAKPAPPKALSASGMVTAVKADSLTVKGKTAEWTFTIDKDSVVIAKGASHKNLALKAENKMPMLGDFVKNGDTVTVTYHDMGSMKHAARITVNVSPK